MSNIVLNPGALGATLGTDTVAGVDYQIMKIGFSASGAAPVQVSSAAPLPVVQTGAIPAGANIIGAVTQSGGPWTDNITQWAGNAVDTNSGNKSAGTLRVVIATDQPSLTNALPVSQSGAWSVAQSGAWPVRLQDGAGTALTSATRGAQQALSIQVVDGSGNQVTSFGGGASSTYGAAFPATGTAAGFSDGTNMQGARVFDVDTGAGTQYVAGVSLRKAASGGSVEAGTSADPLRVDPTGSTTQPVSGTVTANIGTSGALALDASVTGLQVAQGSATAAQKGGLILAAVTTAAPSYTTAQTNPLSLTTAGGLRSDLASLAGTAVDVNSGNKSAGTLRVVIATDQPSLTNALPVSQSGSWSLAANQSMNVAQINAVTPLMGNGVTGTGSLRVTIASDNTAFTVNAAQSGTWTVQPGNTANSTPWLVTDTPATSGGLSFGAIAVSAATNNKTQIKGSAGQLYMVSAQNLNASPRYLKVFNNTSAGVTMGTTVCDYQFLIPGNTAGAGLLLNIDKGIAMGTGITIAVTGGIATNDNTSISANEVTVLIGYK